MLCHLERQKQNEMKKLNYKNYLITIYGSAMLDRWYLLPTVGIEVERRSYYVDFHFLFLSGHIAIEHVQDIVDWEQSMERAISIFKKGSK